MIPLEPFDDRIVVRAVAAEEISEGGVLLPENARENTQRGTVVAIGDGTYNPDGSPRPVRLKIGDQILFTKYGGTEIRVDGKDFLVMRESDVLARLKS